MYHSLFSTIITTGIISANPVAQQPRLDVSNLYDNIGNYSNFITNSTINYYIRNPFLEEIKELAEIDDEGGYADRISIQNAVSFGEELLKLGLKTPTVDLLTSHEIAFVWRHKARGMMTVLFSKDEKTYFSCFFSTTEAVRKGHFKDATFIPKDIIEYIKAISEA